MVVTVVIEAWWSWLIAGLIAWWNEWSTYRPIDFLMFSPTIYRRLFEAQNLAWWPLQVPLLGAALAWIVVATRADGARPLAPRVAALGLAGVWAFVGWTFLHQRFAPIFWVADFYAVAFAVQAGGWLLLAAAGGLRWRGGGAWHRVAWLLGLGSLVAYPLVAPLLGRPWSQAEVFGLATDPTVLGSIALLLSTRSPPTWPRRLRRVLWVVPIAWCLTSAATQATMAFG